MLMHSQGAPEGTWTNTASESGALEYQAIDVWSFGCVLSMVATWMVFGWTGITHYQKIRSQAIRDLCIRPPDNKTHRTDGLSDAFHDGTEVLPEVINWHKILRSNVRICDSITTQVLDLIDEEVFVSDPKRRVCSGELFGRLMSSINRSKLGFGDIIRVSTPLVPFDFNTKKNLASGHNMHCSVSKPDDVKCLDLNEYGGANFAIRARLSHQDQAERSISEARKRTSRKIWSCFDRCSLRSNSHELLELTKELEDRKIVRLIPYFYYPQLLIFQVFLLDNSTSMKSHWQDVCEFLDYFLASRLKNFDEDEIELHFAHDETALTRGSHEIEQVADIAKILDAASPTDEAPTCDGPKTDLENMLLGPLNKHLAGRQRTKTTVIVLSDGVWSGDTIEAAQLLADFDSTLRDNHADFGVQFVQFGSDGLGSKRLRDLENTLATTHDIQ